ncbi:hypothetical protein IAU60_003874 [Kwoniella sp. DSM 27419]
MDVDSVMPSAPAAESSSQAAKSRSTPAKLQKLSQRPPPSTRSLRARPSDPGPATTASNGSTGASTISRKLSQKELDNIHRRLGETGIQARREELVHAKETELKTVVDGHDAATREKFHLERFVTLLTGWDPEVAKLDNSPVFLEWKENNHSLLNLLPQAPPTAGASARAGPSRARLSLPARTTRRQAHEQSDLLAQVVGSVSSAGHNPSGKGKGKAVESDDQAGAAGKALAAPESNDAPTSKGQPSRSHKPQTDASEMPPPPLPNKKGKNARRATIATIESEDVDDPSAEAQEDVVEDPGGKGKKRGRASLPNLASAKKLKGGKTVIESEDAASVSSRQPSVDLAVEPTPPPAPATLPSLAHLPFPRPPARPKERLYGAKKIWYTEPSQRPAAEPKHGGRIEPIIESYTHLEDSGPLLDPKALEARALREGYIRARVMYLQAHGRLQQLLDEATEDTPTASRSTSTTKSIKAQVVQRKTDHQDSLMAHMTQVRNAMLNEARMKPVVCKRVARMVQVYWERIEGREERERLAEEKERKRVGKEMIKGMRKRWALAVKIVRAKLLEAQKLEQDRLGKEHLQNMLQRSTGLLEAQVMGADEDEDDDGTDEEAASDVTGDVTAAEDSDAEDEVSEDDQTEGRSEIASSVPPEITMRGAEPDQEGEDGLEDDKNGDDSGIEEDEQADDADGEGLTNDQTDRRFLVADDDPMDDLEVDGQLDEPDEQPNHPSDIPDSVLVESSANDTAGERPVAESAVDGVASSPIAIDAHSSTTSNISTIVPAAKESKPFTPIIPLRSRRARGVATALPVESTEDPDANDAEFDGAPTGEANDREDAELDVEMEEADLVDSEADSEDEGLLKDADMPIEELLKRYGYPGIGQPDIAEVEADTIAPESAPTLEGKPSATEITDKSLVDEALPDEPVSPAFIVEGKRQRRVRNVWSPTDDKPQQLSSTRKPKIEVLENETESEMELTASESEEDDEEEEEEVSDEKGNTLMVDGEEAEGESPRIRQPFLLRGTLRPYQQGGLEWLASLYQNGMNGILADEMGLGKTIQTISLLAHLACDKGIWGQHLIIVPTSVILNWEMEFKKFLPGMKVLTYYGNQKERKEKRIGWHTENAWQVCITSYQIVLADQHIFRRKSWCYMILDEAHNIKNFRSQRWQTLLGFKAQRRLLLTGTPLQNNLMELWSLLYFLMPGGIGADATAVVGFANHKEFMEWFSNPMDKAVESGDAMDEETLATVAKLHTLLRPFILRRLKAEVEKQLPGKFEHVVYCRLSKRQRFLYDEFMSRASTREALTSGGYLGVMNTLMQLRKVCNHPDLFEVRPVRTSFAMDSVAADYEPQELLVRRRLILNSDQDSLDLLHLGLGVTSQENESGWVLRSRTALDASDKLPYAFEAITTIRGKPPAGPPKDTRTVDGWLKYRAWAEEQSSIARWRSLRDVNRRRCSPRAIYGSTFLRMLGARPNYLLPLDVAPRRDDLFAEHRPPAGALVASLPDRAKSLEPIIDLFAVIPPNVVAGGLASYALPGLQPISHPSLTDDRFDTLHRSTVKLQIAFPDSSLLQYDCGKLQTLYTMLRDLKAGGHRVLIFTQMTRVLDILEVFLSYNGHRYLRLDGSTKIEDRQIITERFNSDPRFFVFIASSRSGGVGINLTGADTVFFYDSDWNPSMDRQCMDRAHRIGQTREVHIYRFVSSHTVEENMLRKAEQKRLLDKMVIQEGGFNNDWWGRVGWKDMFGDVPGLGDSTDPSKAGDADQGVVDVDLEGTPVAEDVDRLRPRAGEERELARALAEVEDEEDVQAARIAQGEGELDFQEFEERTAAPGFAAKAKVAFEAEASGPGTPATPHTTTPLAPDNADGDGREEDGEEEEEDDVGGVEEFMLKWVEQDWDYFVGYRA